MIKALVDDPTGPAFDFADIDQHSSHRIHPAAEDEIDNIIAASPVAGATLGAKSGDIFGVSGTVTSLSDGVATVESEAEQSGQRIIRKGQAEIVA